MGEFEDRKVARDLTNKPIVNAPNATPLPKPKLPRALELKVELARMALLNAQHHLDEAVAALDRKRPIGWRITTKRVIRHLDQAESSISVADRLSSTVGPRLAAQLDQTRRAMDLYIERMSPLVAEDETEATQFETAARRMRAPDKHLREGFDLLKKPRTGPRTVARKPHNAYEAQTLGTVLELIRVEAVSVLARLRATSDPKVYVPLVQEVSAALDQHMAYAAVLIEAHESKDEPKQFGARIEAATLPIAVLHRWILGRQNNQRMTTLFGSVVVNADKLRAAVHLGRIGEIEVGVTNDQFRQEQAEESELEKAKADLDAALGDFVVGVGLGADMFFELGKLQDPPEPDSRWLQILRGLLTAVIGNVIGPGVGGVLNGLFRPDEFIKGVVGGASTAAIRAWAGTTVDAVMQRVSKDDNQDTRDALLFKTAVVKGASRAKTDIQLRITDRIKERRVSASDVFAMAAKVARHARVSKEHTYRETARDFSLFLAQRSLGTDGDGAMKVTKIGKDYFHGTDIRRPSPREAQGIVKLSIEIDASGGRAIRKFQVQGRNHDMAIAVLAAASRRVSELGLPTEIQFTVPWSRLRPIVVVDETGKVRASTEWDGFRASYPALQPVTELYTTPERAWLQVRGDIIPKPIVPGES